MRAQRSRHQLLVDERAGPVIGAPAPLFHDHIAIDAETYWQGVAYNFNVLEDHVYKSSYTKLRELSVSVELPRTMAGRLNLSGITLALTGRNLKTWTDVPNIDPEFSYQTGNNQGIEFAALPNAKVWGLNVRITP